MPILNFLKTLKSLKLSQLFPRNDYDDLSYSAWVDLKCGHDLTDSVSVYKMMYVEYIESYISMTDPVRVAFNKLLCYVPDWCRSEFYVRGILTHRFFMPMNVISSDIRINYQMLKSMYDITCADPSINEHIFFLPENAYKNYITH